MSGDGEYIDSVVVEEARRAEVVEAAKEYAAFMRDPVGKNLLDLAPLQRSLIDAVTRLEDAERG